MPSIDSGKAGSVLFFDDKGWVSFDQMAAALKRRGVRVIRVATVPRRRWLADKLFYHELINLGAAEGRARLFQLLDGEEVFDVVANEPALLALGLETQCGRALTACSLAFRGTPPGKLLDKFAVNKAMEAAGMDTPRQLRTRDVSSAEAVQQLGLPLVIKHPIGAAGDQVRLARTLGEVTTYLRELGGDEAPLFYQEHVPGKVVIYGAVVGAEGALIEHGFRVERAQYEGGPAAEATLYDRPELLAAGRRATALLGPQGFVSFGFIEAADGRLLHIDANIRPWGMIAAFLGLGIDFAEAYAALVLGTASRTPAARSQTSMPLPIFPHRVFAPASAGRVCEAVTGAAAMVRTSAGALGLPYCGYIIGRALFLAARGLLPRRADGGAAFSQKGTPTSVPGLMQAPGQEAPSTPA